MSNIPEIITVLIEYSNMQGRVIVRSAWSGKPEYLEPLEPGNQQNYVKVFDGVDMKYGVGFNISACKSENL